MGGLSGNGDRVKGVKGILTVDLEETLLYMVPTNRKRTCIDFHNISGVPINKCWRSMISIFSGASFNIPSILNMYNS